MQKTQNLQDLFLNQTRKDRQSVTLFLMNGFQMRGIVRGFDSFTVVLETDGKQQLIYKHAISTLVPVAVGRYDRRHEYIRAREALGAAAAVPRHRSAARGGGICPALFHLPREGCALGGVHRRALAGYAFAQGRRFPR